MRKPGPDRLVEVSSMVIDFEGVPAILAFVRDVTVARRAQAEIERTQRLAALGALVAGVAHAVNNPLAYAKLGAEMLERFFAAGCHDVDGRRDALASIVSGLDSIASVLRELRTFARADEPMPVPVELSEVLTSAFRLTAAVLRPRARVEVGLGVLPVVRAGPSRLEQVFVNLLVNVAQSFEGDDVSQNVVHVHASREGEHVRVTSGTTGAGSVPSTLVAIFDRVAGRTAG